MARTDVRALTTAMATRDVHAVYRVLFPSPRPHPEARQQVDAVLAAHALRRCADALDHDWTIPPDEWALALEWLRHARPELFPPVDGEKD